MSKDNVLNNLITWVRLVNNRTQVFGNMIKFTLKKYISYLVLLILFLLDLKTKGNFLWELINNTIK
ncbi:hypothetical protein BKM63_21450 [Flavobacterium johnsoniae]|uniref:Uncharacterized protein n=1 Tax=Flavobacterium johnsoniae TaxID=986 RepID=A0A1J7BMP3_FLAJO|nr:hypothetical protein BKM63_21450 [Flavobacterium johnsoniae]